MVLRDTAFEELASNEILAGLYVLLLLGAIVALKGPFHPRTPTLKAFCLYLMINACGRIVYFGIPPSVWDTGEAPEDLVPGTKSWYLNGVQFALFLIPNWAWLAEYVIILRMWCEARQIVNGFSSKAEVRYMKCLRIGVWIFLLWSCLLSALYFLIKFHIVLILSSILNAIVSLILGFSFVAYWYWLALAMLDVRRQAASQLYPVSNSSMNMNNNSNSVTAPLLNSNGNSNIQSSMKSINNNNTINNNNHDVDDDAYNPSSDESDQIEATSMTMTGDPEVLEVMRRANEKLLRISGICSLCLACSLTKAGMETYQINALLSPDASWTNSWWLVILLYYSSAEVLTTLLVLVTLRKGKHVQNNNNNNNGINNSSLSNNNRRLSNRYR